MIISLLPLNNICNLVSKDGYLLLSDLFHKPLLFNLKHVKMRDKSLYENIFTKYEIEILEILPVHYIIDKFTFPMLPRFMEFFKLFRWFYQIDTKLRQHGLDNGSGMKMLLAQRKQHS